MVWTSWPSHKWMVPSICAATDHQLPVAAQWLGNPRTRWRCTAGKVNDQWWIFHQRLLMRSTWYLILWQVPPFFSPRNRKKIRMVPTSNHLPSWWRTWTLPDNLGDQNERPLRYQASLLPRWISSGIFPKTHQIIRFCKSFPIWSCLFSHSWTSRTVKFPSESPRQRKTDGFRGDRQSCEAPCGDVLGGTCLKCSGPTNCTKVQCYLAGALSLFLFWWEKTIGVPFLNHGEVVMISVSLLGIFQGWYG